MVVIAGCSSTGFHSIFKTFHRCLVNIYQYGIKSPARNGDLESMSFVPIVTSILVGDSFFAQAFFVLKIQMLQFVHLVFLPYQRQFYIHRKGPFLSFNQGPHTTLMRPWVCARYYYFSRFRQINISSGLFFQRHELKVGVTYNKAHVTRFEVNIFCLWGTKTLLRYPACDA